MTLTEGRALCPEEGDPATPSTYLCLPLSDPTTSTSTLALGAPPRAVLLSRMEPVLILLSPVSPQPLPPTCHRHTQDTPSVPQDQGWA